MVKIQGRPIAAAQLRGDPEHMLLRGTVRLYQMPGGVLVEADITGLPPTESFFGFHIHEGNACTGIGFADTGPHYDPLGVPHPNHAGDLPPLLGDHGRAYMCVLTDRFSIPDVIGRTVVIHSMPDDLHSQPAGNSGSKIACGVFRRIK